MICENFIIYHGEKYTIKQTAPKVEGDKVFIEVTAYHIMYEFQITEWNQISLMTTVAKLVKHQNTLRSVLKIWICKSKNIVKMTYKIIGDFKRKIPIDELGNKNDLRIL